MTSPDDGAGTLGAPVEAAAGRSRRGTFEVTLDNFTGPFDLLLSLIAKHQMDVTEVALAEVTDEFVAYLRAQKDWDLSQASEFLVIGATLLDLKAARLLPGANLEDSEDLELLEARDLLFARLLQYRAFKDVASHLAARWETAGRSVPRSVRLEPRFAALLPELVLRVGPEQLAALAALALVPKPVPQVGLGHLHAPTVSVREQAALLVSRLRHVRATSFRALTDDAEAANVVVARFLALLDLFREGAVAFDQAEALGELTIRWTGSEEGDVEVGEDFDEVSPAPDGDADGASGADAPAGTLAG
ncbi:chromosome segregation and condensation protein ScpA [Beutenbergia cavernae DSM 12333]|uniref:Segregation and condensation protein A n=1 Tax=Beutenbergia cavernae (strain ATCC BAA-8 / DSM 12333 / CCUG 43141 / JCM 11478 / NBRC 16432 / NCIMB 13614 / HKI 0122) TaxID=471853 RepID=C5C6K1_BEUC1|nr:chromosome segregation and condensation protein ScpA [Beutenbergia cavernae DSM 12333]